MRGLAELIIRVAALITLFQVLVFNSSALFFAPSLWSQEYGPGVAVGALLSAICQVALAMALFALAPYAARWFVPKDDTQLTISVDETRLIIVGIFATGVWVCIQSVSDLVFAFMRDGLDFSFWHVKLGPHLIGFIMGALLIGWSRRKGLKIPK